MTSLERKYRILSIYAGTSTIALLALLGWHLMTSAPDESMALAHGSSVPKDAPRPDPGSHVQKRISEERQTTTRNSLAAKHLPVTERDHFFNPQVYDPGLSISGNCTFLPTRLVEDLVISPAEKEDIESKIAAFQAKAEQQAAAGLKYDSKASDPEAGRFVYNSSATSDRGEQLLAELRSSFEQALGKERGERLCGMFNVDQGPINLAMIDARLEVRLPAGPEPSETLVYFNCVNPETGKEISRGYSSINAFHSRFGNLIDFKEK